MAWRSYGRSWIFRAVLALTLANDFWFIWSNRFVPLSDFPDWVFQGYIFSRMLRGELVTHYAIHRYPVPYWLVTLALGLLDLVTMPETSAKIVLSVSIILFVFAAIYLLKSLNASEANPLLYVVPLYALNNWFFFGEISYVLGLSLMFIYAGYLFRRLDSQEKVNVWLITALSCVIFLAHPLPYLTALMISAIYYLSAPNRRLLTRFSVAFLPSMAMLVWYALGRASDPLGGNALHDGWHFWTMHLFAGKIIAAFSPFPAFPPWLGIGVPVMKLGAVLDVIALAGVVALWAVCATRWIGGHRAASVVLASSAACLVASVVTGYALYGWVGPGERFFYPAAGFALCWLGGNWQPSEYRAISRAIAGALVALLIAQGIFFDHWVGMVADRLGDLYVELRATRSRDEFCDVYRQFASRSWEEPHRRGLDRFLTSHASAPRLPYYMFIEDRVTAPIFQVGVLSYDGPGSGDNLCGPDAAWQIRPGLN